MRFRILLAALALGIGAAQAQTAPPATPPSGAVYTYVEQMPQPPGGMSALMQYLGQTLQYPAEALQQNLEGKVYINFVVSTDGRIEQAKVVKSAHPLLDAEALRVVSQLPAWTPGRQTGRAVNVSYTLPIAFHLPAAPKPLLTTPRPAAEAYPPRPAGGQPALETALQTKLTYPEAARQAHTWAVFFVQLPIDSLGRPSKVKLLTEMAQQRPPGADVKALKEAHQAMSAAALAALQQVDLPWEPARLQGKARSGSVIVPVLFDGEKGTAGVLPRLRLFPNEPPVADGGAGTLLTFLGRNVRYPAEALRSRTQGKVMVLFEVSETGAIENPVVIQSVSPEIDKEAARVVALMPPMHPALEQGQPVRSFFIVPVSFKIR
jgi:TonB family protein